MRISRRRLLHSIAATGIGLGTGTLAYGALYERHQLSLARYTVRLEACPPALDGLTIGLLTDLHHSTTLAADTIDAAVGLLQKEAPDLVMLGGDYVSFGDRRYIGPAVEHLATLARAPYGAFAVLGNHDDERDTTAAMKRSGLALLRDDRTRLTIRGETIDIAGLRFWSRRPQELAPVFQGAASMSLLLAHDPRRVLEADRFDIPLVLSGHTHGGQVLLPGVGAVVGRKFPVLSGMATHGRAQVCVSRGVGTVYLPVRINCPPDVSLVTLRSATIRRA
jgi:predicted MPP superfamily phosphohydrolase